MSLKVFLILKFLVFRLRPIHTTSAKHCLSPSDKNFATFSPWRREASGKTGGCAQLLQLSLAFLGFPNGTEGVKALTGTGVLFEEEKQQLKGQTAPF